MNFVLQMMNFVFKMMNFVLQMMNFVFKMMNFNTNGQGDDVDRDGHPCVSFSRK